MTLAAPTVVSHTTVDLNALQYYKTITIPGSLQVGDLVMVWVASRTTNTLSSAHNGWSVSTGSVSGIRCSLFYRFMSPQDIASSNNYLILTVSPYTAGDWRSDCNILVVRGASHINIATSTFTSATVTKPAVTPTISGKNYLYVGAFACTGYATTITASPAGYSGAQTICGPSTNSTMSSGLYRTSTDASDASATWTLSGAQTGMAWGIAIYGGTSVGGTVRDENLAACARTVMLHDRSTGALLSTTTSNASTGAYEMPARSGVTETYRVVLDSHASDPLFNDLIDQVVPG